MRVLWLVRWQQTEKAENSLGLCRVGHRIGGKTNLAVMMLDGLLPFRTALQMDSGETFMAFLALHVLCRLTLHLTGTRGVSNINKYVFTPSSECA